MTYLQQPNETHLPSPPEKVGDSLVTQIHFAAIDMALRALVWVKGVEKPGKAAW